LGNKVGKLGIGVFGIRALKGLSGEVLGLSNGISLSLIKLVINYGGLKD
jgi:hypothetical protein